MSNIVKHQCPSCGGKLSIDNDEADKLAADVKNAVFEFVKKDTLVMNGKA